MLKKVIQLSTNSSSKLIVQSKNLNKLSTCLYIKSRGFTTTTTTPTPSITTDEPLFSTYSRGLETPFKRELKDILTEKKDKKKIYMVEQLLTNVDSSIKDCVKNVSYLINDLIKLGEIEKAKELFNKLHSEQIKLNEFNRENKKSKENAIVIEDSFRRKKDDIVYMAFEVLLLHYLSTNNIKELIEFFKSNIQEYPTFLNSKNLISFFDTLTKNSFETFSELVYFLYQNENIISEKFSVNIMIYSLRVDKSDTSFNQFYKYHKQKWGILDGRGLSDLLPFLIPSKSKDIIVTLLNDVVSSGIDCQLYEKYIQNLLKLFSRTEKDPIKLRNYQNLVFHILAKQPLPNISNVLFFYNTFFDVKDMKVEYKISLDLLKRFNREFLSSFPIEIQKTIVDQMILMFLRSDQYEKALYWFCSWVSKLGNTISKDSICYFVIHHQLLSNTKDVNERSRQIRYYTYWRNMLNSHFGDENSGISSVVTRQKFEIYEKTLPYKILNNVGHLGSVPRFHEMESAIKVSRDWRAQEFKLDLLLKEQISKGVGENSKFTCSEIIKFIEDNYLIHDEIPMDTLLLDVLLLVKKDEILSKLENRKPKFIEALIYTSKPNPLIISPDEYKSKVDDILKILQQLLKKEQDEKLSDTEVQILKSALFNLFYYRSSNLTQCIETFSNLVERKVALPFKIIEQATSVILENKSKFDDSISNKMDIIYNYLAKFTNLNPTFEDGYLITLINLIDSRKFQQALTYISTSNFKSTQTTLTLQLKCYLELYKDHQLADKDGFKWNDYFDEILKFDKFNNNLSFLFDQIINQLSITSPIMFKRFEQQVLKNPIYKSNVMGISNQSLSILLYNHKRSQFDYDFYIENSSPSKYVITSTSDSLKNLKLNDNFTKQNILNEISNYRYSVSRNGTSNLSSIFK